MTLNRRTALIVLALAAVLLVLWGVPYLSSSGPLEIVKAEYGVPGRTCNAGPDIKRRVSSACADPFHPRCLVSVSTDWCGDPAVGMVKTLTVDYKCGQKPKRASASDNSGLVLECP
jgi:hypothetical protein